MLLWPVSVYSRLAGVNDKFRLAATSDEQRISI